MIASQDRPKERFFHQAALKRPRQPACGGISWAARLCLASVAACSTQTTSIPAGTGGASGHASGGSIRSGGAPGTGGQMSGGGGSVSAGGTVGGGGSVSTGGTVATGGAAALGGSAISSDAGDAGSYSVR